MCEIVAYWIVSREVVGEKKGGQVPIPSKDVCSKINNLIYSNKVSN
jgi:hypothetical protein